MKKIVFVLAAATAAAGCAPTNPAATTAQAAAVDANSPFYAPMFLQMAASSNLWEIQSSEIAHPRAQAPSVHSFATMITTDHQMLGQQMMAAAQAAGLPPPPQAMMPEEQAMLAQLQAAGSGPPFDRVYRDLQVAAHQKAIGLFQNYAASGDNPTLRATAAQALPKLQQHLVMAQSLQVAAAPPLAPLPAPPPAMPAAAPAPREGERG
jgi:putative membrane protein